MTRVRILPPFLILGLAALAGCNFAPKYQKPAVSEAAAFKETPQADDNGWKPAEPSDAAIRGSWWELYNDPVLNSLEEKVRVSNQSILAAAANFRSARALAAGARAELFPIVTADPSFARTRTSQTVNKTNPASANNPNPSNLFDLPVDASYQIDLWGKLRDTAKADALSATAAAADVASVTLTIQAELAADYFEIRALDAERQVYEDAVAAYRQELALTRTLYRTGIDSDEDIANAQTQLDTVTAEATDLGVARAQFEHAIAVLTGQLPSSFSLATAPFDAAPPSFPLVVPSTLLERRPDIASAERLVQAANLQIGVARAAYFPSISLSAAAGFESAASGKWLEWPSRIWSFGPQASQVLFAGGALKAVTDQAWAQYDQTVANYRQTVLSAFQAVEDNLAALRILSREAVEERTAVASAQHFLDLSLTRYKAGIDSYLNVVTAQQALTSDREALVQVQLRLMSASVSLISALGGGWDQSQLPDQEKQLSQRPE